MVEDVFAKIKRTRTNLFPRFARRYAYARERTSRNIVIKDNARI